MGRPRITDKRKHRINSNLNKNEQEKFRLKLEKSGLSEAEFIRCAVLEKQVIEQFPLISFATLKELNAIGKNINLIARWTAQNQENHNNNYSETLKRINADIEEMKMLVRGER